MVALLLLPFGCLVKMYCKSCSSDIRCRGFVCRLWLSYFLAILTYFSGIPSECQTTWIHFIRPVLGPNCLQRVSADGTSRQELE